MISLFSYKPHLPVIIIGMFYKYLMKIILKKLLIFSKKKKTRIYISLFSKSLTNPQLADDYFRQKHVLKENGNFTIKNQYLEKINKNQVKIAFDLGLNSGLNVIAYNKLLPNLEKTYGFEVIYDYAKCE